MDFFFNEQKNNNIFNDEKVVVYCEKSGRRCNTYIVGWKTTDDNMKNTLKSLTKLFGCGGAIKMTDYEGKQTLAINLQGNFVVKTGEYLKSQNIVNLIVKELVN